MQYLFRTKYTNMTNLRLTISTNASFILATFALFFLTININAQALPVPGDCLGAYIICSDSLNQTNIFTSEGNIVDELPSGTCLFSNEQNNVWYIISIEEAGFFGFNILPQIVNVDFDWIVFDITGSTCSDISSGLAPILGCDYSSIVTPSPATGMNNGSNLQDEPMVFVQAGTLLALCVNNFGGFPSTYMLKFNIPGTSASVIDETAPSYSFQFNLDSIADAALEVNFTEYINCQSIHPVDFTLINPFGDTLNLIGITGSNCQNGGAFEKKFFITLEDSLDTEGVYSLSISGSFEDMCGNSNSQNEVFQFTIGIPNTLESLKSADIKLSPNPVDHELNIDFRTEKFSSPFQLMQILDAAGRVVQSQSVLDRFEKVALRINVAELPVGLYHLRLSNHYHSVTKAFLKF
jgi:hypothetical protein